MISFPKSDQFCKVFTATAALSQDGTYTLIVSTADEGQVKEISEKAAHCLQCSADQVTISALRNTSHETAVSAALQACRELKTQMSEAAARLLQCNASELLFERQGLRRLWTGQVASSQTIARFVHESSGNCLCSTATICEQQK